MGSCTSTLPETAPVLTQVDVVRRGNRCIPTRRDALRATEILRDTGRAIVAQPELCQQQWPTLDRTSQLSCNTNVFQLPDQCRTNSAAGPSNELLNNSDSCRGTRIMPYTFIGQIVGSNRDQMAPIIQNTVAPLCSSISNEWRPVDRDFTVVIDQVQSGGATLGYGYNGTTFDGLLPGSNSCGGASNVMCERVGYDGAEVPCCLKNWSNRAVWGLNQDTVQNVGGVALPLYTEDCFEPAGNYTDEFNDERTCSPWLASPTSTQCLRVLTDYCSGRNTELSTLSWMDERWIQPNRYSSISTSGCDAFMNELLVQPFSDNVIRASEIMSSVIQALGTVSTPDNSLFIDNSVQAEMWNKLTSYCSSTPGLCDDGLLRYCSSYSAGQVSQSQNLQNICGCFLPASEYRVGAYDLEPQCSPLCSNSLIKRGQLGQQTFTPCVGTTCIIDNLTVNALNSSGSLDINQYCGGCGRQPDGSNVGCTCLITDTTIDVINSNAQIVLEQNCTVRQCTGLDEEGNVVIVPCNAAAASATTTLTSWSRLAIVVAVLLFLIAVVLFFVFIR